MLPTELASCILGKSSEAVHFRGGETVETDAKFTENSSEAREVLVDLCIFWGGVGKDGDEQVCIYINTNHLCKLLIINYNSEFVRIGCYKSLELGRKIHAFKATKCGVHGAP